MSDQRKLFRGVNLAAAAVVCVALSWSYAVLSHAGERRAAGRERADLAVETVDMSDVAGDAKTRRINGTATVGLLNQGASAEGQMTVIVFEDSNFTGAFEPGKDNELGRQTLAGLTADTTFEVDVEVAGKLNSSNNWLSATVELEDVDDEADTANNTVVSGRGFGFEKASEDALNPVLEWAWTSSSTAPDSINVMMTPAVADLNDDGIPDVVFGSTASRKGRRVEVGLLRALDGNDGTELFTVTSAGNAINTGSSVAIADIDGDEILDIVACDSSGKRLIAFNADGTFKWRSPELEAINWGEPQIVDLDGDGLGEIVVGRQVVDSEGALMWTGEGGRGGGSLGSLVTIVDMDLDGFAEVVAGNTVYGWQGEIVWQSSVPDGYTGSGEFDDDSYPEIVHVSKGEIRLLDNDGSTLWGPVRIPGGGRGGRPTVADLDGDGVPEIGVAGREYYVVLSADGSTLWKAKTQDRSSSVTSSAAYDFNRDGTLEIVYRDERFLRFYNGPDGTVLFETPMSSGTWHEHPVVVDVDADDEPEILAVANNGLQRGVFVFREAGSDWLQE